MDAKAAEAAAKKAGSLAGVLPAPSNVPLLRASWSALDGIYRGILSVN